jgi:CheY-like chemotaxis protein
VDDDADARELIERILLDCGATVFAASNAMDALSLLKKHRPDVVVSDIGMPDIDGYELIRRVRALDASEGGATSAVALTAFTRADDHKKALEAGFDRHMRKPLEPSTLVATIVQLLNCSA